MGTIPGMRFGEKRSDWEIIALNGVLCPFSSRADWLLKLKEKNEKLKRIAFKRQTTLALGANARSVLDKNIHRSKIGKVITSAEMAQQQEYERMMSKVEERPRLTKLDKLKTKLEKGQLYNICEGSQVCCSIIC